MVWYYPIYSGTIVHPYTNVLELNVKHKKKKKKKKYDNSHILQLKNAVILLENQLQNEACHSCSKFSGSLHFASSRNKAVKRGFIAYGLKRMKIYTPSVPS